MAAFALRPQLQQHPGGSRFTWVVVVCALGLLVAGGARPWLAGARGRVDLLAHPVVELADALRAAGYDGRSLIFSPNSRIAAALRTRFPQAPAAACSPDPQAAASCVRLNAERARAAGLGWLLVVDAQDADAGWWAPVLDQMPGLQPRPITLALRLVPAAAPPIQYTYVWQPGSAPP